MTYILDRREEGGPAAHILIVGAESYDGDEFENLSGLADASIALGRWWAASEARLMAPTKLGSVRLLVSCEDGATYPGPGGPLELEAATTSNVRMAMEEWIRLSAEGGVGVLCWAGHGGAYGQDGGGILDTLFCSDELDGRQLGISWSRTLNGINSLSRTAAIYCFLDVCRSEYERPISHDTGVRLGKVRNLAQRAFVHLSAAPGLSAWSYPDPIPAAGFPGGPLGTRALLDALDRFGAAECYVGGRTCSTAEGLQQALDNLNERLLARVSQLDGEVLPTGTDHVRGAHFSSPFMLVPSPASMLDVLPMPGTAPSELVGSITGDTGPPIPLPTSPRGLEAELPHGSYEVTLFPVACGRPMVLQLRAMQPRHRIWHPGVDGS